MWHFLFIILVIVLVVFLVVARIKDKRDVMRRTVASIGDDLWKEIDEERNEAVEKGKYFRRELKKAKERNTGHNDN